MTQLPQRRSRAQMQEETRSRLIEAANDIIAEGGVAAASIRGVCERAGFSQGAFYSNFADKEELLLALLEQQMHAAIREIEDLMARIRAAGLDHVPVIVGGIIPDEDAKRLTAMGVARVYTPKDFELNRIMMDLVALVDPADRAA